MTRWRRLIRFFAVNGRLLLLLFFNILSDVFSFFSLYTFTECYKFIASHTYADGYDFTFFNTLRRRDSTVPRLVAKPRKRAVRSHTSSLLLAMWYILKKELIILMTFFFVCPFFFKCKLPNYELMSKNKKRKLIFRRILWPTFLSLWNPD